MRKGPHWGAVSHWLLWCTSCTAAERWMLHTAAERWMLHLTLPPSQDVSPSEALSQLVDSRQGLMETASLHPYLKPDPTYKIQPEKTSCVYKQWATTISCFYHQDSPECSAVFQTQLVEMYTNNEHKIMPMNNKKYAFLLLKINTERAVRLINHLCITAPQNGRRQRGPQGDHLVQYPC